MTFDPFSRRDEPRNKHPQYGRCDEYGPAGACSLCTGLTEMGDGIVRELETGRPVRAKVGG